MSEDVMHAAFSDPLLRDMAANALAGTAPNNALTSGTADLGAVAVRHWALASEMGWTATLVSESYGGLGLGLPHVADICEQMGRHLFCGPFIETAVLLPLLAREAGGVFAELLPAIISGEARAAIVEADGEALAGPTPSILAPVEHAANATHLVVLSETGPGGLQVSLIDMSGAELELLQPIDPTASVGRLRFDDPSRVERYSLDADAARRVLTPVHVTIAADLLGIGEAALTRSVEHVRGRKQFGQPIGAFQAVKHRLADAYTALAGARLATAHAANSDACDAAVLARVLAAEAALKTTGDAIQFHGGLGFSWEVDLHLYLKRARRLNARNGGTARLRRDAGDAFIAATLDKAGLAA